MGKTNPKIIARNKRIRRIRKKIFGTPERPRLRVFKSLQHTYAQIINDVEGNTIVSMSTLNKEVKDASDLTGKKAKARKVGELIAREAQEKGIKKVVFDRGGYIYHGRIQAVSEGAKESGLEL